ncbi:MAG: DUF4255 domain-containing protein [Pseudomonadota bacterium]
MHTVLRATTITLTELLREQFETDADLRLCFNPNDGGDMVVTANTPPEMADANEAGLSVWLYRIDRDENLVNQPRPRPAQNRLARRPLPLRLHYLMTPIVPGEKSGNAGPHLEQAFVGKVLQTFHDLPTLTGVRLRDDLASSDARITVRWEPMGLEEITRVWDALEASYNLCVSYEVSVLLVDSASESSSVADVTSVDARPGIARPQVPAEAVTP